MQLAPAPFVSLTQSWVRRLGGVPAAALFLPAQDLQSAHFRTTVNFDKFINWSLKCHLQNGSLATETQAKIFLGKADKYFKKWNSR